MDKKLLILLGNGNEPNGKLSEIALSRADLAIKILNDDDTFQVIPTGAFGDHFNLSFFPHGELLTEYLISKGIDKTRILPYTRTSNTLEDAYSVLQTINKLKKDNKFTDLQQIHIISSQFHLERVKFIFGRVFQGYRLNYHESGNVGDPGKVSKLQKNEKLKIAKLEKEWVDIANLDFDKFPDVSYENLGNELRHYDNLSYISLSGAVIFFGFLISNTIISNFVSIKLALNIVGVIFLFLFQYLYLRFADTAFSARRIMNSLEKFYGVPGLSLTKIKTKIFKYNIRVRIVVCLILYLMIFVIMLKSILLFFKN